jgi:hypothetical protein
MLQRDRAGVVRSDDRRTLIEEERFTVSEAVGRDCLRARIAFDFGATWKRWVDAVANQRDALRLGGR